jgi:hypothetical protein
MEFVTASLDLQELLARKKIVLTAVPIMEYVKARTNVNVSSVGKVKIVLNLSVTIIAIIMENVSITNAFAIRGGMAWLVKIETVPTNVLTKEYVNMENVTVKWDIPARTVLYSLVLMSVVIKENV